MKKITYTKTTRYDADGEESGTHFVVKVDGIEIGTSEKSTGWGRYGRETKWESGGHQYDTRTELVNALICVHFGLTPYDHIDGGIKQTVADFLAA
jgi:hypothetical protein